MWCFLLSSARAALASGAHRRRAGCSGFRRILAVQSRPQCGGDVSSHAAAQGTGVALRGGPALTTVQGGPGRCLQEGAWGPLPLASPRRGTRKKGALVDSSFFNTYITEEFPACPIGLATCPSVIDSVPVTEVSSSCFASFFLCLHKNCQSSFAEPPQ